MLRFPWWKILIIFVPCVWGFYSVIPHFFYSKVEKYNDIQAQIVLGQLSENELSIADKSTWYYWAPSRIVNLGLDLRGGAHVLVEVSLEEVYSERLGSYWPQMRKHLRTIRNSVGTIKQVSGGLNELLIRIGKKEGLTEAIALVRRESKSLRAGIFEFSSMDEKTIKI